MRWHTLQPLFGSSGGSKDKGDVRCVHGTYQQCGSSKYKLGDICEREDQEIMGQAISCGGSEGSRNTRGTHRPAPGGKGKKTDEQEVDEYC